MKTGISRRVLNVFLYKCFQNSSNESKYENLTVFANGGLTTLFLDRGKTALSFRINNCNSGAWRVPKQQFSGIWEKGDVRVVIDFDDCKSTVLRLITTDGEHILSLKAKPLESHLPPHILIANRPIFWINYGLFFKFKDMEPLLYDFATSDNSLEVTLHRKDRQIRYSIPNDGEICEVYTPGSRLSVCLKPLPYINEEYFDKMMLVNTGGKIGAKLLTDGVEYAVYDLADGGEVIV